MTSAMLKALEASMLCRTWVSTLLALLVIAPAAADDNRGGLAWNNTSHFTGRGHGVVSRSGSSEQRLLDVSVDIDRGGRILVSFRVDHRPPLRFSGSVIGSEGDPLKADVATEDNARLRGSLYLSRNRRGDAIRITLEATNGQDHLHLEWSATKK